MSKETANQGYIDALAYATDPDNVSTPDQQHSEYERGIKSYGLSQDGDSAALNSLITPDTINELITITGSTGKGSVRAYNTADTIVGGDLEVANLRATPTNSDESGRIYFRGKNSALETVETVLIRGIFDTVSDGTESSSLEFLTYASGTQVSTLTLREGKIVAPTGGGINFNGTVSAANTLDNYEEGTFTPSFANIGTGTMDKQIGRYTRIGDLVHCHIYIRITALGTASGAVIVTGLPFASDSTTDYFNHSSAISGSGWSVSSDDVVAENTAGTTTLTLLKNNCDTTNAVVQHSDLGTGNILFSVSYRV